MKKYIKHIVAMMLLTGSIQSCDSYLEELNPNYVSSAIFWSNLEESEANLTSVYGGMLNQYILGVDNEAWRSDIGFPGRRNRPYGAGLIWHEQRFTNGGTHFAKSWDGMYRVIWRANQVIQGLEGMGAEHKEQARWKEQMAEARFFRGLMHFWLHSNYNGGSIIIRDKVPSGVEEFSPELSPANEVQDFFRSDLQYAYENLPAQQAKKSRVTAGTAALVLGKTYLYTEEYSKAKEYLATLVNPGNPYGYSLLKGSDVKLLFTHAGDFNSESIFELNYSDKHQIEESNWDEESFFHRWARYAAPTGSAMGGQAIMIPSAWLTYAYSNEVMDSNDSRNYHDGNNLNSVSLRCAQNIAVVNDEESTYYQSTPGNKLVNFTGTLFSHFKKFTNHDIVASENDVLVTAWKSAKNVLVYRLADAYLMYAECLIQEGDLDGGMEYINEIRKRWGLQLLGDSTTSPAGFDYDDVIYTQQSLMEHLMFVERPLELSLEGYAERAIDLRRWGVAKQRYQDLAAMDFHLINYAYTTAENVAGTRARSHIQIGPAPDASADLVKEFGTAAINYTDEEYGYLPLPSSEILYNDKVN